MAQLNYYIEHSPTRDKHAQGIAEQLVGVIATKSNVVAMTPTQCSAMPWDVYHG